MNRGLQLSCLAALLCVVLVGCRGYRIAIEPYDGDQSLRETTILADDNFNDRTGEKVAMIPFEGVIMPGERFSLIGKGENPVSTFVESLDKARKDERVKAVIVYINSPGGAVTTSDVLYKEVKRFKGKSGKPVVVMMGDVAASGGYYLACAGDEIMAHPTTITGSIGVLIQLVNFSEGMSRIGIHARAVVSGENKTMGSPFEPEEPQHRELFQQMVNEYYARFVSIVKENRPNLSEADLPRATDGRVVTGEDAVALGLVDSIGYIHDAFKAAKKRAGITEARLVRYHRDGEYVPTAYAITHAETAAGESAQSTVPSGVNMNLIQLNAFNGLSPIMPQPGPTFYYLWSPGAWGIE